LLTTEWKPTECKRPSSTHRGETTPEVIYTEVGRALHAWEHAESAFIRLFQVFCESKSAAACRAYGVIESPFTKSKVLRQASEAFFGERDVMDKVNSKASSDVIKAYENASQYRNNIAHGMTLGRYLEDGSYSGYFLSPPSYAAKKVKRHKITELYLSGAQYFYSAADLLHYTMRFREILDETVRLAFSVNEKYAVLDPSLLHP
jgi:hypothetical protein